MVSHPCPLDKRWGFTIGAISGPSEALPSSEALEIPEALERRRGAPGGKWPLAPRYGITDTRLTEMTVGQILQGILYPVQYGVTGYNCEILWRIILCIEELKELRG